MLFKSKLVFSILFTVCLTQSTFAADETNETLMPKGMWKDPDTGLIWMRCGLGQKWNGSGCDGEAKDYKWWNAIKAVDKLVFAGKSDWRIPTATELSSLLAGQVLHGKEGYAATMQQSFESSWRGLSLIVQNDYEKNYYFSNTLKYKTNDIFNLEYTWSSTPAAGSDNSAWALDLSSYKKNGDISTSWKGENRSVRAVRSALPMGSDAFLNYSKLAKQIPSDEAAFRKSEAIKAKEKEQQVHIDMANKKNVCSHLYVGKAVKVNLCSTLFGCSNYDAEITGIGNGEASAKITESGNEYGKRHELNCEEFKY